MFNYFDVVVKFLMGQAVSCFLEIFVKFFAIELDVKTVGMFYDG